MLGVKTRPTLKPTAASKPSPYKIGYPRNTTGLVVINSCSLRKVTTEPAKLTEPTTIVKAVAIRSKSCGGPVPTSVSSTIATIAAAPPPTPLNNATSCGIWVIWTRYAPRMPIAVPAAMAAKIGSR
jgi:hypothetical protein